MAKKVTNFEELPRWFRDADYLQSVNFSDIDWFFHLEARYRVREWDLDINRLVEQQNSEQSIDRHRVIEEDLEWYRGMREEQIRIIRRSPASSIDGNIALTDLGPAFDELGIVLSIQHLRPITRITLNDLFYLLQELPSDIRDDLFSRLWERRNIVPDAEFSALAASYVELSINDLLGGGQSWKAVNRHAFGLFRIDLALPDDALRNHFNEVLKTARSDFQRYQLYLDQNIKIQFEKWAHYGLLPYLDLKLWAIENDRSISSGFLVKVFDEFECIFDPDLKYSAYTIDTTVKNYVDAALSWQTRRMLQAAACTEIERRENI